MNGSVVPPMFRKKTVKHYLGTEDDSVARSVEDKAYVIGYIRYLSHVLKRNAADSEKGKEAIAFCAERLREVLPRVETLDF